MTRALGLALLLGAVSATAATGGFKPPSTDEVRAAHAKAAGKTMAERLTAVSEPFLGAPYVLSPLGEGAGPDKDPRVRYDAFDCTTFVETSIALSRAASTDGVLAELDAIRYRDGKAEFVNRRHFPEAEWLPELIAQGVLTDITPDVAGEALTVERKTLDLAVWGRRKHKDLLKELDAERIPKGVFAVNVWPLDDAVKGYAKIPPGTVLSVVRADYRSIPVRVSHQGLVIKKGDQLFMRHAADRVFHRVVDEPLESFLKRIQKYRKWPVTGVHLARVNPPAPPAAPR